MINLQKLFRSIRLNPCDEFQAKQIKVMMASLEVENPEDAKLVAAAYEERKKMLCPVVEEITEKVEKKPKAKKVVEEATEENV